MPEETVTVTTEMPRYKCHKEVHALKLAAVTVQEDGSAIIQPTDVHYSSFLAGSKFVERFKGTDDDPGYYVVYEDGYESWSPTKAFEDGYTAI